MKCDHEKCKADAKWAPAIRAPATGWAIDLHQPLKIILSLAVCDAHWKAVKLKDFLKDDMKEIFRIAGRANRSQVPPDFSRAYLEKVSVNSNEYKLFEKKSKPVTTDQLQSFNEYRAHGGRLDFTGWQEKEDAGI